MSRCHLSLQTTWSSLGECVKGRLQKSRSVFKHTPRLQYYSRVADKPWIDLIHPRRLLAVKIAFKGATKSDAAVRVTCHMRRPKALPLQRGTCEAVLLLAVSAWLGLKTGPLEGLGLTTLAAAGVFAEACAPTAYVLGRYSPRLNATPGISLSVLALPLLCGAKLSSAGGGSWDHLVFWVAIASGAGAVTSVLHKGSSGNWRRWWPAVASTACCSLCSAGGASGFQVPSVVALLAGGCQYSWHFVMRQFPQSFTAGEAFLVAQGSTLLVGAVLLRTLHLEAQLSNLDGSELEPVSLITQAVLTSLLTSAAAYAVMKPAFSSIKGARAHAARRSKPVSLPQSNGELKHRETVQNVKREEAKRKEKGVHEQNELQRNGVLKKMPTETGTTESADSQQIGNGSTEPSSQQVLMFYFITTAFVGVLAPLWLSKSAELDMVTFAFRFLKEDLPAKAGLCCYWLVLLGLSLPTFPSLAASRKIPSILVRKAYHVLAVAMFAPALLYQPVFLQLAFGGALSLFLLLEIIRLHRIPPLAAPLDSFLRRFTDDRDSGPLIVSHFSLLLGCALPLWLGPGSPSPSIASFAGVLSIGLGDTMASLVGVKYGRTRICTDSKKTVEGTTAGFLSMLAGLLVVQWSLGDFSFQVYCIVATLIASLLEAFTLQSDNVFVPVVYAALLLVGP